MLEQLLDKLTDAEPQIRKKGLLAELFRRGLVQVVDLHNQGATTKKLAYNEDSVALAIQMYFQSKKIDCEAQDIPESIIRSTFQFAIKFLVSRNIISAKFAIRLGKRMRPSVISQRKDRTSSFSSNGIVYPSKRFSVDGKNYTINISSEQIAEDAIYIQRILQEIGIKHEKISEIAKHLAMSSAIGHEIGHALQTTLASSERGSQLFQGILKILYNLKNKKIEAAIWKSVQAQVLQDIPEQFRQEYSELFGYKSSGERFARSIELLVQRAACLRIFERYFPQSASDMTSAFMSIRMEMLHSRYQADILELIAVCQEKEISLKIFLEMMHEMANNLAVHNWLLYKEKLVDEFQDMTRFATIVGYYSLPLSEKQLRAIFKQFSE